MRKKGFFTSVLMLLAMVPGNLHAKAKAKKITKNKTRLAHKGTKHSTKKRTSSASSSGMYSTTKNNRSPIVTKKMNELRKYHEKVLHSGTPAQKKKVFAQKKLLASYNNWKGTKYAWGGDSKRGIDCSALTRRVYREVYHKELPRVSTQQVKLGRKVATKNLQPGDILFFKPGGRTNHTTVYVGNSLFINASSSKGVVMSSLKSPYWKKYYKYSVRINKNT